jgi:hypothetical protein
MQIHFLWDEVAHVALDQLPRRLLERAQPFGGVTMKALVAPSPGPSTGLYFFFEESELMYVGKASSRAIIERVPAHLDSRDTAWFGTLLKYLSETSGTSRVSCVPRALLMKVAVVFVDPDAVDIGAAETILRGALAPSLNPARRRDYTGTLAENV